MKSDLGVSYLFNLHISSLNLLLFFKIFLLFWYLNSNKVGGSGSIAGKPVIGAGQNGRNYQSIKYP